MAKYIPKVDFSKLKTDVIYETDDYSAFKHPDYNRGEELGFSEANVKKYVDKIKGENKDNPYYYYAQAVIVNKDGWMFDGNSKKRAAEKCGKRFRFWITSQPELNSGDELEFTKAMIHYNGVNSAWTPAQLHAVAVKFHLPVAVRIDEIIGYINANYEIDGRSLKGNKLVSIAKTNVSNMHGKKLTLQDYMCDDLLNAMNTKPFFEYLSIVVGFYEIFKGKKHTFENRIFMESLLKLYWSKVIDAKNIYSYVLQYGFGKFEGLTQSKIEDVLKEIHISFLTKENKIVYKLNIIDNVK